MPNIERPNVPKQLVPGQGSGACHDVDREGGMEILNDPDLQEITGGVVAHIAAQAEATYGGARDALIGRCAPCLARAVCPVEGLLKEKAHLEQEYAKLAMLRDAHPLLTLARLDRAGMTYEQFAALTESEQAIRAALANGSLNPTSMLGGMNNWRIKGGLARGQLPALAYIPGIKGEGPFDSHIIGFGPFEEQVTYSGQMFIFVDCMRAHDFKGKLPDKDAYRILAGKLFARMRDVDSQGVPHILHPDNTQQKVIRDLEDGRVDELRMRGKNRLYIAVCTEAAPDKPQIIVLGAHGGDAAAQRDFIATLQV